MRPQDTAYIIERLAVRFMAMVADHERQLAEHRASFGARTEADAKIIAGLREERDGLLTQVQDMRAEIDALNTRIRQSRGEYDAIKKERDELNTRLRQSIARGDFAEMRATELTAEIERLKKPARQHPVAVGESVRRTTEGSIAPFGTLGRVLVVWSDAYQVELRKGFSTMWAFDDCTPCDPPQEAFHDTPEGKLAAESVIRNDRKTEPDEIKVGDLVEVFQARCPRWTAKEDLGLIGRVARLTTSVDNIAIVTSESYGTETVALADVRKVTT